MEDPATLIPSIVTEETTEDLHEMSDDGNTGSGDDLSGYDTEIWVDDNSQTPAWREWVDSIRRTIPAAPRKRPVKRHRPIEKEDERIPGKENMITKYLRLNDSVCMNNGASRCHCEEPRCRDHPKTFYLQSKAFNLPYPSGSHLAVGVNIEWCHRCYSLVDYGITAVSTTYDQINTEAVHRHDPGIFHSDDDE